MNEQVNPRETSRAEVVPDFYCRELVDQVISPLAKDLFGKTILEEGELKPGNEKLRNVVVSENGFTNKFSFSVRRSPFIDDETIYYEVSGKSDLDETQMAETSYVISDNLAMITKYKRLSEIRADMNGVRENFLVGAIPDLQASYFDNLSVEENISLSKHEEQFYPVDENDLRLIVAILNKISQTAKS